MAVIGSGFIGCEIAASLRHRGHGVTLRSGEPGPTARRLGAQVGEERAGWLSDEGVTLGLGTPVEEVWRDGNILQVRAGGQTARASGS